MGVIFISFSQLIKKNNNKEILINLKHCMIMINLSIKNQSKTPLESRGVFENIELRLQKIITPNML
jgi:hypothetical protein